MGRILTRSNLTSSTWVSQDFYATQLSKFWCQNGLICMHRYDKASWKFKVHFSLETRMLLHKREFHALYILWLCVLDTVQDFLIKLGIKPRLHIVLKISIFSLNHVIVRPTKIMNNLLNVCKICTFKFIFRHQKSTESFWIFFSEEYLNRRSTFINEIFWKLWFLQYFVF